MGNSKYQGVVNNQHLVNWYFSNRLYKFFKVFFDGILDCSWCWYRFELQSRTAICAHGAARFKNDPELIDQINRFEDRRLNGYLFEMYESVTGLDKISCKRNPVVNIPKVGVLT